MTLLFSKNLQFLSTVSLELADKIRPLADNIEFCADKVSIRISESESLSFSPEQLRNHYLQQISSPSRIRYARPLPGDSPAVLSPKETALNIYGSHEPHLLNSLLNIIDTPDIEANIYTRDLLVLGSLNLIGIWKLISDNELTLDGNIVSITLVDSSPLQLAASFSCVDFKEFVGLLKSKGISFNYFEATTAFELNEKIFFHYTSQSSSSLHGIVVVSSPYADPALAELRGWLFSKSGFAHRALSFLGYATDELNQLVDATNNISKSTSLSLLSTSLNQQRQPKLETGVILVASGPSLDSNIEWLKKNHLNYTIIASGSSFGTLVRNHIHVDYLVLLERGAETVQDFQCLVDEGFEIQNTNVIASLSVTPIVSKVFESVSFFTRPLSAFAELNADVLHKASLPVAGPECVNAALEVLGCLGINKVLAFGCDFGSTNRYLTRSASAVGTSPRSLDVPVMGSAGKTVFSDSSLLMVRDVFETIVVASSLNVARCGVGVEIKNVKELGSVASSSAVEFMADVDQQKSLDTIRSAIETLEVSNDLILPTLIQSQSYLRRYIDQIKNTIITSKSWDKTLSQFASSCVSYSFNTSVGGSRLVCRLLKQPLFFIFQSLYDCQHSELESWASAQQKALLSLDYVFDVTKIFLDFCSSRLEPSSDVPSDLCQFLES